MDFAYPSHLLLLTAVLVIGGLFWLAQAARKRKLKRFGRLDIIGALMPYASKYKPRIKIVLELLAIVAIVIVLARPRYGEKQSRQSRVNGIEIMIAFDLSNSMLASSNDDPSGVSRLDRAKLLLEKLLNRLDNDKVGLVVFAGEAKTQMPLTPDHYTAKMYINDLSPELVQMQGTSITDAINLSVNSFSPDDKVGKAIILITDAEDHEGDAIEAAEDAVKKGIQVDVIGVGSTKGAMIPLDRKGNYLKDRNGEVVVTKIDENAAKKIAKAGKGVYVNGSSSKALDELTQSLDNLDKGEFDRTEYKTSAEQFPTFTWITLILLLIDLFVLERKIGWLKNVNFFSKDANVKK
ncbi:MAG: VWA domain-containing protein [Muribaculaceae bacterium]|nr:VWA domain-containing protein [Muribaculaceae bacterium]